MSLILFCYFPAILFTINYSAAEKYEDYVYGKPYCRIVPYIVGVLMGYVFYTEKTVQKTMSKVSGITYSWISLVHKIFSQKY